MTKRIHKPKDIRLLLEAAVRKLAGGKCWTKGWLARDDKGLPCRLDNSLACKWCISGAVLFEGGATKLSGEAIHEIERTLKRRGLTTYSTISDFNDSPNTKWKDINSVINDTIKDLST